VNYVNAFRIERRIRPDMLHEGREQEDIVLFRVRVMKGRADAEASVMALEELAVIGSAQIRDFVSHLGGNLQYAEGQDGYDENGFPE
jgi:hypothetical protein